jgi:hypothetical protein
MAHDDVPLLAGSSATQAFEVRSHPRFQPSRAMNCHLTTTTGSVCLQAKVVNLSRCGIRLTSEQPLAPGTCALVEVVSSSRLFTRCLLLHVLYATEQDGRWFLGGEFLSALSANELTMLLS